MEFRRLDIPDLVLFTPRRLVDARGWFAETFSARKFAEFGIDKIFVQNNHSLSCDRGTVRALHFQLPPHDQAKLVRVVRGAIYDVAVDLRRGSPTYGKHVEVMLTEKGGEQLYVPNGFAHGFCTLEADTEVLYKVDRFYAPDFEGGIIWNDPQLAISWPVKASDAVLSDKDKTLRSFTGFDSPFA